MKWLCSTKVVSDGNNPDLFQKQRTEVLRHKYRVSENVYHDGGFLTQLTNTGADNIARTVLRFVATTALRCLPFSALIKHNID